MVRIERSTPADAKTERQILIALIISDAVCLGVHKLYNPNYFQTKMTKEVSSWCMEFYKKYDSAIKHDIQTIFETKTKAGHIDPDLGEEIEIFLTSISSEYEDSTEFNTQFYIDLTQQYFKKRSYSLFASKIKEAAENDNVDEAEKIYSNFIKVQEQQDTSRDILSEEGVEAFRVSMESRPKVLFTLPGHLGKMIGPIERETLIGLLGREKIGKTYVLQMLAKAGAKAGLRVAFIQTGDLTHDQLDTRIANDIAGGSLKEERAGKYYAPVMDCIRNQLGNCSQHPSEAIIAKGKSNYYFTVDTENKSVLQSHKRCIECYKDLEKREKFKGSIWWEEKETQPWTWGQLLNKVKKFKKRFHGEIITQAFPMQTVKMSDIRNWLLQKQKQDGKLFGLVLIDYPDIMLAEKDKEYRHGENEKWMQARRISQEFHNCVVLVTQANSKAFGKDTLKLDNFSEDKRKFSHVTHFYAINKSETEEKFGAFRLGALMLREDSIQVTKQVTVLQDLRISKSYVSSFYGRVPDLSAAAKSE